VSGAFPVSNDFERLFAPPNAHSAEMLETGTALAFAGLAVDASGTIISVEQARTLTDAQRRANELRADLELRKVHADVLRFCREELLADNYFHAILEAAKSVADKLRQCTGLSDDGGVLFDRALGGEPHPPRHSLPGATRNDQ
jgi:hypothetical protein